MKYEGTVEVPNEFPTTDQFNDVDEWLVGLQNYGHNIGARPLGVLPLFSLMTQNNKAKQFWIAISDIGSHAPQPNDNPTIEEQLRSYWNTIKENQS